MHRMEEIKNTQTKNYGQNEGGGMTFFEINIKFIFGMN